MTELDPSQLSGETVGVSRRNVLRMGAVAAWTVPVIVTLQASPAGAASPPPGDTSVPVSPPTPQPVGPPDEPRADVKPDTVVVPPEQSPSPSPSPSPAPPGPRGDATGPTTDTPSGGLAFTGAEIGGLVVLGTGAVALGTAAVWSARRRDDEDEPTAVG